MAAFANNSITSNVTIGTTIVSATSLFPSTIANTQFVNLLIDASGLGQIVFIDTKGSEKTRQDWG